jgi:hypothetical protein
MLQLWREHGGNAWLRRFCHQLRGCPGAPDSNPEGARRQSWNWYLAASVAAQCDLSGVFVNDWRLPLSDGARQALAAVNWKQPDLTAAMVDRHVRSASPDVFQRP